VGVFLNSSQTRLTSQNLCQVDKFSLKVKLKEPDLDPETAERIRTVLREVVWSLDLGGEITMKLRRIPAGRFLMGSPDSEEGRHPDEGPQHEVTISKPFYMGVFEVTQEQYQQVMGANPSYFKGATDPVETVSWDDAMAFCKTLLSL